MLFWRSTFLISALKVSWRYGPNEEGCGTPRRKEGRQEVMVWKSSGILGYGADMAVTLLAPTVFSVSGGDVCRWAMLTGHVIETSSGHFYSFVFIPGKKHSISNATDRDMWIRRPSWRISENLNQINVLSEVNCIIRQQYCMGKALNERLVLGGSTFISYSTDRKNKGHVRRAGS